jgi:hypothetical protein
MQVEDKERKETGYNPEKQEREKDIVFPHRGRGNEEGRALWLANFITILNYFLF